MSRHCHENTPSDRVDPKPVARSECYDYFEPELTHTIRAEISAFTEQPVISIVMPVYNSTPEWLQKAIDSVVMQWYPRWQLCIVDDCSDDPATIRFLEGLDHPAIVTRLLKENVGIAVASNEGLSLASGEFVALLDHDDELTPDALYEVIKAINGQGAEFIYSDEDKLELDGSFSSPHFKPDFSPDMFLSQNYLCHLTVIKKSIVDRAGGFTPGTDGAQDYDLYLKVLEHTNQIVHIPRVLYHWRKVPGSTAAEFKSKSYAQNAGALALSNAIQRRGLEASVQPGRFPGTYRVRYHLTSEPLVSIVIPFKDKAELLRACIGSILNKSTYRHFEIIGISNNSELPETRDEMERFASTDSRIVFQEYNAPFNYSEINNYAIRKVARGEQILLLNNDTEIISPDWIESLLEFSQRPDVGVVGARLYYPDGRLQHSGVVIGIGGVAAHPHKDFEPQDPGYFARPHIVQNLSAVTAACCMVKRVIYEEVGGMDEANLTIAFNDVDFCLRVREAGYLNVYTPYCESWHHESASRGSEVTQEQKSRFRREVAYMKERHARILKHGDPYYNRNLTLTKNDFSFASG